MRKKQLRNIDCSDKICHRYIVNFIDGVSEKEQDRIVRQFGGKVLNKFRTPELDRFAVVHIDDKRVNELLAHDLVESIDQDISAPEPSKTEVETWGHATAQVFNFWNAGYTGAGVKVAIIDTGVTSHPDLPVPLSTWDVVNNKIEASDISPGDGHGTCSAGIIAARNNGSFVKGLAYDCDIHVINCYYENIELKSAYTNITYTIAALQHAATLNVDVVLCNVQLGFGAASLKAACDALEAKGVPILAPAGNFADETGDVTKDTVTYPGHYDKVVAVGAVEEASTPPFLARAPYSGTGPYLNIASYTNQTTLNKNGGYKGAYGGTSCATPFATGVVALLKQAYPSLTAQQLRDKLYAGVTQFGTQNEYGAGLIGLPTSLLPRNPLTYPMLSASTIEDFTDSNFNFNITGDFVLGTDGGRSVLRTPAYSNPSTGISRFTFQLPSNSVNPEISITHREDCSYMDVMLVTVNGVPLTQVSRVATNYTTRTLPLKSGGKYIVEFHWNKRSSTPVGLDAVFIKNISVNFTSSGGGEGTPGDSFTNPIVVFGTTASGTVKDTKDLYFKYTAPRAGSYVFTTTSSFDAYMELRNSSNELITSDDDSGGSSQPKIMYTLAAGQIVYLKVFGYNHQAGKYGPITLKVVEPTTGSVPGSVLLTVGSPSTNTLTLNYSATGATSYDIYRNGTRIVAGRTQTSYTDTGLSANTQYSYHVTAMNSYGSNTSSVVNGKTSSGGVTPTTKTEDFSDQNFVFDITGDWTYNSSAYCMSVVTGYGEVKQMQFTENIPSGANNRALTFRYKDPFIHGDYTKNKFEVLVNGVVKLTSSSGENVWKNSPTIQLGTGTQTITFRATAGPDSFAAYVDDIVVSWS